MTYLTRPVFPLEINWSDPVNKRFAFDLGEVSLGFGAEFFTALQTHVIQGYDFSLVLNGAEEIFALDAFTAALTGRVQGFWLPAPLEAASIVASVNGTAFKIANQNLRDTWTDHPDVHLSFTRPGSAPRAGKIVSVTLDANPAYEVVTLQSALSPAPAPADTVSRLHYVRLAEDVERATFLKEGTQKRTYRVVELPHEYAAYETGTLPIYLYHFWCAAPMDWHWRYTSFAADVVSGNELFTKFPLTHSSLKQSTRLDGDGVNIEARHDPAHPLALFLPIPFARPMNVEILQVTHADPETQTRLFVGQVRTVDDQGEKLTARCDAWSGLLKRKLPAMMITPDCNYHLFHPATCKADRARYETSGVIAANDASALPPTLTVDLHYPAALQAANWLSSGWFAGGFIETGFGLDFELRTVLSSVATATPGQLRLTLNAPLEASTGARVQLIPGCDGQAATCQTKFKNFVNFGGFPAVPDKNLSLKAVDAVVSQGDKK